MIVFNTPTKESNFKMRAYRQLTHTQQELVKMMDTVVISVNRQLAFPQGCHLLSAMETFTRRTEQFLCSVFRCDLYNFFEM